MIATGRLHDNQGVDCKVWTILPTFLRLTNSGYTQAPCLENMAASPIQSTETKRLAKILLMKGSSTIVLKRPRLLSMRILKSSMMAMLMPGTP